MVRFIAAIAAITSLFSATPATAENYDLLQNVNIDTIAPVFRNAGKVVENTTINGDPALVIREENSIVLLRPRVCAPDCKGLYVYALFRGNPSSTQMNDFNRLSPPTVVFSAEGNAVLKRYLIADYGITEGTLMVNYDVFKSSMAIWRQQLLQTPRQAVSLSFAWPSVDYATREEVEDEAFLEGILDRRDLVNGPR